PEADPQPSPHWPAAPAARPGLRASWSSTSEAVASVLRSRVSTRFSPTRTRGRAPTVAFVCASMKVEVTTAVPGSAAPAPASSPPLLAPPARELAPSAPCGAPLWSVQAVTRPPARKAVRIVRRRGEVMGQESRQAGNLFQAPGCLTSGERVPAVPHLL